MYSIVHFLNENKVEMVPSLWIDGNNCKWPPTKSSQTINLLRKNLVSPEENWTAYNVRILYSSGL